MRISFLKTVVASGCLTAWLACVHTARAATATLSFGVDTDNNTSTGCVVTTSAGVLTGIEVVVETTVSTTSDSGRVTTVAKRACVASALSNATPISSGGWAVGMGAGTAGSDVIETGIALVDLGTTSDTVRVVAFSASDTVSGGLVTVRAAQASAVNVPTLSAGSLVFLLLTVSFVVLGVRGGLGKRVQRLVAPSLTLVVISLVGVATVYAITRDGNPGDWVGPPLSTDAKGDAPAGQDLVALYAFRDAADLSVRIDAVLARESVSTGNQPPVVAAGTAQTIVLGDDGLAALTLSGSASDDGKPSPLALTTAWSVVSAPTSPPTLLIEMVGSPTSVSRFSAPGTYVLRLTANDGEFSRTSEVTITVNPAPNVAPNLSVPTNVVVQLGDTFRTTLVAADRNVRDHYTFSLPTAPTGMRLLSGTTGQVEFVPSSTGTFSATARVQDQNGMFDQKSFNVTVVAANRAPRLTVPPNQVVAANALTRVTLSAVDPDGDAPLTFLLISGPAGMQLVGNTLEWTPTNGQVGGNTVIVAVRDPSGAQDTQSIELTVGSNSAPLARDDRYEARVGEVLTIGASLGVLANDTDPDGSTLTATKLTDPDKGTLTSFAANGGFSYTPPASVVRAPMEVEKMWSITREPLTWNAFAVGDIDGDGTSDLIITTQAGFTAYRGDGTRLWTRAGEFSHFFGHTAAGAVLADIDDDGELEFVSFVGSASGTSGFVDNALVVLSAKNGTTKLIGPSLTPEVADHIGGPRVVLGALDRTGLTVARLYADQKPKFLLRRNVASNEGFYQRTDGTTTTIGCEAVTGRASDRGVGCRATFIVNHLGETEEVLTAPNPENQIAWYLSSSQPYTFAYTADLDGDGTPEIISGGDVYKRVNGAWTLAWTTRFQPAHVAVADLDGDGKLEVIHAYEGGGSQPNGLHIFDFQGNRIRTLFTGTLRAPGFITVADLDGDGGPDILFYDLGVLHAYRADGRPLWLFAPPNGKDTVPPLTAAPPAGLGADRRIDNDPKRSFLKGNAIVYDLDGDGINEVVLHTQAGTYILNGRTGIARAVYGLSGDPGQSASFHLVALGDMNNDGKTEIITVSGCPYSLFLPEQAFCDGQFTVLRSKNNDWLPGPKIWPQIEYQQGQISDAGAVAFNPPIGASYRNPSQLGVIDATRQRVSTQFTYSANDGSIASSPATVTIDIEPTNRPPVFTSVPPTAQYAKSPDYPRTVYFARAIDPDPGDTVRYELVYSGQTAQFSAVPTTLDPVTGELKVYSGPCGSFGAACNWGRLLIVIAAIDSLGARTEQAFYLDSSNTLVTVPNVVGQSLAAARTTLTNANLQGNVIAEAFDAAPAGTVLAQNALPGASDVSRNATVHLTISKGAEPIVSPNVVGLALSDARVRISGAGFTPRVTDVFSTTVERGIVIAQNPAAGTTQTAREFELSVSAGSGLSIRLSRTVATTDQTISVTPVATRADGSPGIVPALTYTITEAIAGFGAPLPTLVGSTISAAPATRGAYRITATDAATGRTASEDFVYNTAPTSGGVTHTQSYASMLEALETIYGQRDALNAALAANDTPALTALVRQMVTTWRTVDLDDVRLSTPIAPAEGFPLSPAEMRARGLSATPDDLAIQAILRDAADDLKAWIAGLKAPNTSIAELERLATRFNTRAARLDGLTVSRYGAILNHEHYALIVSRLLPELFEAHFNDLGQTVGIAPRTGVFPGLSRPTHSPDGAKSTLAEVLVNIAVRNTVDYIMNEANKRVKNAKKFATDIMKQAVWAGAAVAAANELKSFVVGQDIVEVVSGASLSFRVFNEPTQNWALIEVPETFSEPLLSPVMIIGPDTVADVANGVKAAFEKIKEGVNFGIDPLKNDKKFKNLDELKKFIKELNSKLKDARDSVAGLANLIEQSYQYPTEIMSGCIFSASKDCRQLYYEDGFSPVYRYNPPPGFEGFSGIPVPIIFIAQNQLTGTMYFATPNFLPAPKAKPATP